MFFLFSFLFANTRSQKGEREKEKERGSDLDEADQLSEADLSLMARTKRQAKFARENLKKNSKACSSLEEEALDLEELLAKSREKAESTKAARERVACLRRELEEFENGEYHDPDSDQDLDPIGTQPVPAPVPAGSRCRHGSCRVSSVCGKKNYFSPSQLQLAVNILISLMDCWRKNDDERQIDLD